MCNVVCRRASSFPVVNNHRITRSNKFEFEETVESLVELSENSEENKDESLITGAIAQITLETVVIKKSKNKSVRFADDCGGTLYIIKQMTEPSDFPPKINPKILRRYRGLPENDENDSKLPATWTPTFTQPASDYVIFREKVTKDNIALENVRLKNEEHRLAGTIKVKNIAFEKRVFIRVTTNEWQSYTDHEAKYMSSSSRLIDTFGFEFEIPSDQEMDNAHIEFCVCFEQYWDSNGRKNYSLKSEERAEEERRGIFKHAGPYGNIENDAYLTQMDNWSRFASWKLYDLDQPYY
ncbi:unnamed protein product [Dracunculus medinensis]|uniref:CBM21 domain-containing protein n=1 Tax=Dracunculus medinensis TaxID=318479 RepID=A0A3P7PS26_DRAME|nr:unnamed protein product [Dracunculus medinensis]